MTLKPRLVSSYDEDCMSTPCHTIWSTTHGAREQVQSPLRLGRSRLGDIAHLGVLMSRSLRRRHLGRKRNGLGRPSHALARRAPKGGLRVDVVSESVAGLAHHGEVERAAVVHDLEGAELGNSHDERV